MRYIADNAEIIENPEFEAGVVKIQREQAALLTDAEKAAVSGLLNAAAEETPQDPSPILFSSPAYLVEAMNKNRKREHENARLNNTYVNCDFIAGSVAEVERLWSLAGHILTDESMSTTPTNAMLFLKVNKRFWDETTVQKAMDAVANESHSTDEN